MIQPCAHCGGNHYAGSQAETLCQNKGSSNYRKHMSWAPSGKTLSSQASSDFSSEPSIPRLSADEFHDSAPDAIINCDDIEFTRVDAETITPIYEPDYIRVQFPVDMSEEDMHHAAQCLGYAYAESVRGEPLGEPKRDGVNSFYLHADTTKTRRDDLGQALDDFEGTLHERIVIGSPIRKTNRAGEGTKGTRLVEGLGIDYEDYVLYYG